MIDVSILGPASSTFSRATVTDLRTACLLPVIVSRLDAAQRPAPSRQAPREVAAVLAAAFVEA